MIVAIAALVDCDAPPQRHVVLGNAQTFSRARLHAEVPVEQRLTAQPVWMAESVAAPGFAQTVPQIFSIVGCAHISVLPVQAAQVVSVRAQLAIQLVAA